MNNLEGKLKDWLQRRQQVQAHRQLLVITGSPGYCQHAIEILVSGYANNTTTLLGRTLLSDDNALELKRYRDLLGGECTLAIYDAFDGLRPNAILALSGTVISGGLMVICCPTLSQWPQYQEQDTRHYLSFGESCLKSQLREYLAAEFEQCSSVAMCNEQGDIHLPLESPGGDATALTSPPLPFATDDQQTVFSHIVAELDHLRYALITAHRGRGKSTLMGMLAGQALLSKKPVLITSRHESAAQMVFKGLLLTCPDAQQISQQQYRFEGILCRWVPLDHHALHKHGDHLLIVDEAAATPVPVLKQLCCAASSALLSTTMLGYEGSGRGFTTRFMPWLNKQTGKLIHCTLQTPVRWFAGDPLEQFWHHAFALDTTDDLPEQGINPARIPDNKKVIINTINKQSLIAKHGYQILGLLMQAHYQTTADELVRLADSPNQHTLTATCCGEIIGVLNYQLEGAHALVSVADAIASGTRRVNGHLSAQALALLVADPQLATFKYWRINRIAVLPEWRRNGIGTQLIGALNRQAIEARIDGITTTFGYTDNLAAFWRQLEFLPVKPGLKKDAASGEYSLLMLKALSSNLTSYKQLVYYRFHQELNLHPAEKAFSISSITPQTDNDETIACNNRILRALVNKRRSLQHSNAAIAWLLNQPEIKHFPRQVQPSVEILSHYIETLHNPTEFIQRFNLSGKRATETYVVEHLDIIYGDRLE